MWRPQSDTACGCWLTCAELAEPMSRYGLQNGVGLIAFRSRVDFGDFLEDKATTVLIACWHVEKE